MAEVDMETPRTNPRITELDWLTEMAYAGQKYILAPSSLSLAMLRHTTTRWLAARDGYDWEAPHWNWYRKWSEAHYRRWAEKLINERFPETREV